MGESFGIICQGLVLCRAFQSIYSSAINWHACLARLISLLGSLPLSVCMDNNLSMRYLVIIRNHAVTNLPCMLHAHNHAVTTCSLASQTQPTPARIAFSAFACKTSSTCSGRV